MDSRIQLVPGELVVLENDVPAWTNSSGREVHRWLRIDESVIFIEKISDSEFWKPDLKFLGSSGFCYVYSVDFQNETW